MAKTASRTKTKTTSKKTTTKAKPASTKKRTAKKPAVRKSAKAKTAKTTDEEELTIDRRRDERREEEAAKKATPPKKSERREKVQRRRQIDPTTCERDYSDTEVEFMNAMDEYKRTSGRMFPTCSEVLEVIRDLGYAKVSPAELALLGRAPVAELAEDFNENEEADNIADEAELVG